MNNFLIIQTAFIGDVILATPIVEALNAQYPEAKIDFLLRKGNEELLTNHPHLNEVLIWDKKQNKYKNLFALIKRVRKRKYQVVINIQRFGATGFLTVFSSAKIKIGFKNNPFAFAFTHKIEHSVLIGLHETDRNLSLLTPLFKPTRFKPVLYPSTADYHKVRDYKNKDYICAAPTSVWFTKQFAHNKWLELFNAINKDLTIYLLGGPSDYEACQSFTDACDNKNIVNLAGKISMLESAALMRDAQMNYVNDSAPMHMASAVNANTTAIFCSTIPAFGFGPLSDNSKIVEVKESLPCRPCGLHGLKACPEQHFNCAQLINIKQLID